MARGFSWKEGSGYEVKYDFKAGGANEEEGM